MRRNRPTGQAIITAKFNSKCAETGTRIKKDDTMVYDYDNKKCYCMTSNRAIAFKNVQDANRESKAIAAMQQEQEDAMYRTDYVVPGYTYHPLL
jgi:hypothetical protein